MIAVLIHKALTVLHKLKRVLNRNQSTRAKVKSITGRSIKACFLVTTVEVCKMYPVSSKVYFSIKVESY